MVVGSGASGIESRPEGGDVRKPKGGMAEERSWRERHPGTVEEKMEINEERRKTA